MVLEKLKQVRNPTYVQAGPLTDFVASLFHAAGMPSNQAREAAEVLVDADLHGIDTHGVAYNIALHYLPGLRSGYSNPTPRFRIAHETPSTAVVDGDRGIGMIAGRHAMNVAIGKAAQVGIGVVALSNSSHYGAAGYYPRMALEHDMIGLTMSAGGPRVVIPMGGKTPWMGTNPIAFAAPADREPPFVLDMATSVVAYGKVAIARAFGVEAPEGWAVDAEGEPVTDVTQTERITGQPPLGETHEHGAHKGYGLGVMADILCAVLPGETPSGLLPNEPWGGRFCQYFQAIRIDAFRPAAEFKSTMDEMLRALRAQPTVKGYERVQYAGLPEHEAYQKRIKEGIPLPEHTVRYFRQMADELGVPYTLPDRQAP